MPVDGAVAEATEHAHVHNPVGADGGRSKASNCR